MEDIKERPEAMKCCQVTFRCGDKEHRVPAFPFFPIVVPIIFPGLFIAGPILCFLQFVARITRALEKMTPK